MGGALCGKSRCYPFLKKQIHRVDFGGYILFHAAKILYQEDLHIRISEVADPQLTNDDFFDHRFSYDVQVEEYSGCFSEDYKYSEKLQVLQNLLRLKESRC